LRARSIAALFLVDENSMVLVGWNGIGRINGDEWEREADTGAGCGKEAGSRISRPKVEDDYQWLENDDDRQSRPGRMRRKANTRLSRWMRVGARSRSSSRNGTRRRSPNYSSLVRARAALFAIKFQPPKQQPMLVAAGPSANDLKSEKSAGRSQ